MQAFTSKIRLLFIALAGIAVMAVTAVVFIGTREIKRPVVRGPHPVIAEKKKPHPVPKIGEPNGNEQDFVKLRAREDRGKGVDRESIRRAADTLLKAGEFRKAEVLLERLLVWLPADEDIERKAIWVYEALDEPGKALDVYEELLKLHPLDTHLLISAAKAYVWADKFPKGLELYSRVIKSGQADRVTVGEYADLLYLDREYGDAETQYRILWKSGELQKKQGLNFYHTLAYRGKNAEAAEVLEVLLKEYPGDIELLSPRAESAFALKFYDRSVSIYRELLRSVPNNEQALLTIARVSSWKRDYDTSLAYYDKLIAAVPSNPLYYREKARVLGWMTHYGEALSEYEKGVQMFAENRAFKAEADAKRAYYRNAYNHSLKAYNEWLALEPHHPEALFDMGQFAMQYGRWRDAAGIYDSLLAALPDHRMGLAARESIRQHSTMTILQSGVEYFRAESTDRQTDVSYTDFYATFSHPLQERLSMFVKLDSKFYTFKENSLTPRSRGLIAGVEYSNQPDILLRAAYGWRQNSGELKNSQNGYVEAASSPVENVHLGLGFHRYEVIQNYETFLNHLQTSRWQGRLVYDGYRRWNAGADYAFERYSDGNGHVTAGADLTAHLLYDPERLNVSYRLQSYAFSESRDYYWTPSSFVTHTAGMEWRHHFRNADLFQGGNDSYVSTAFRLSLEPGGNVSHQIQAGMHYDWSQRLSTALEYQYTWDTTATIYEDKRLNAVLQWVF
ncbi:MAG: tetratricopeptide repeat protein [Chlorobiaceae bacterium]